MAKSNVTIKILDDDRVSNDDSHAEEAQEHLGPLPSDKTALGQRSLRRNSISLPELNSLQMDALEKIHAEIENNQQTVPNDEQSMACSLADRESDSEVSALNTPKKDQVMVKFPAPKQPISDEDDDDELPSYTRRGFRKKRRPSIAPLPSWRINSKDYMANELDDNSIMSNQASITSVSSLASLLREKMQAFPQFVRKKKRNRKDFKIKLFVSILFLLIVFLVGYAYIMYHQQLLAKSYFDKIKFNPITRAFRIFDENGKDIVTGTLAENLYGRSYPCLPEDRLDDGSVCMEWTEVARMYLNEVPSKTDDDVKCYSMYWKSLVDRWNPEDCFDMGSGKGYWYGGGLLKGREWPLQLADFEFEPFITGDHHNQQFGNAIKRYFLNSNGVAIMVDDSVPLYLRINKQDNQLCIKSKQDDFAFFHRKTQFAEMKYEFCTAKDMLTLHKHLTQKNLWDGAKEEDLNIVHSLLEEPVWQIPAEGSEGLTETAIYNYTENVIGMGFLRLGHVLINEFWQPIIGDFKLDTERFPTLENTINILHRRGFRVAFTLQPYISTESKRFAEAVAKGIVVTERGSGGQIPALTRYKGARSAALLDVTNNASLPWLLEKLKKLQKTYAVDSFFLDTGSAYNIPRYYEFNETISNPDDYKTIFTSRLQESLSIIGIAGSVAIPKPPTFLSLPAVNSSWDGLKTTITAALAYGVIGYPFIMPGPIGGDFLLKTNDTKYLSYRSMSTPPLPDIELYIRWMQLATFLPVIRFTHLPSEYKSEVVTEVAKELTSIRTKTVIPSLKKFLNDAMNEGLPFVRPLWMMDPRDPDCLTADDQFIVGEDLIVAPIIQDGSTQREVYLPQGVWKDGIDNSLRKGDRWIHNYRVPINKIAYFIKMPDNTRF